MNFEWPFLHFDAASYMHAIGLLPTFLKSSVTEASTSAGTAAVMVLGAGLLFGGETPSRACPPLAVAPVITRDCFALCAAPAVAWFSFSTFQAEQQKVLRQSGRKSHSGSSVAMTQIHTKSSSSSDRGISLAL